MICFFGIALPVLWPAWAADNADVAGTWKVTTESQFGKQEGQLALQQDAAGKLEGRYQYDGKETDVSGQVTGDQIELKMTVETRGGSVERTLTGTVQGNSMTGTFKTRGGQGKWSATKAE
ncbi:MAG: hypothetical protein HY652_12095 [Acidobacteria bacterium]|nr:hypothetical protein [Acidobacteriota bacterium]